MRNVNFLGGVDPLERVQRSRWAALTQLFLGTHLGLLAKRQSRADSGTPTERTNLGNGITVLKNHATPSGDDLQCLEPFELYKPLRILCLSRTAHTSIHNAPPLAGYPNTI